MAGYLCPMPIGILFANGILSLLGRNKKERALRQWKCPLFMQ
jgi:hypothetical protein